MEKIKKIKQAVILAGGMGIRLRPYTYDNPKPMVPVNGKPFLAYLIEMLKKNGIEEVVMLLGYLPEKIREYLGDGSRFGIRVKYSVGALEDETGTRVRNARDLIDGTFLLMYCDNYLNLDLAALYAFHEKMGTAATVTVYNNRRGITKNNILVDDDGYVKRYDQARMTPGLNGVEIGFFIFEKRIIDRMPPRGNFWLFEFLPVLIGQRDVAGFRTDRIYHSISTEERLKITERFHSPRKVVLLDRDGVINYRPPKGEYVLRWEQFKFLPHAIPALAQLSRRGYEIYLVSNQAGIGRGLMSAEDLFMIHRNMEKELARSGVFVQGIYYCPHRSDEGCFCRKPNIGMFHQAAIEHQINLDNATFIGDDPRDEAAGNAAGCRTILMESDGDLLAVVQSLP